MSDDFARKLDPPVIFTDSVLLKGAGTNNNIPARYTVGTTVTVGKTETKWRIIVAKITVPVILGLELLTNLTLSSTLQTFHHYKRRKDRSSTSEFTNNHVHGL